MSTGRHLCMLTAACDCTERSGKSNQVTMQGADEGSLDFGLNRALDAWYNDRDWFNSLAKRCMLQVSSSNEPAE